MKFVVICCGVLAGACALSQPTLEWERRHAGTQNGADMATAVAVDQNGFVYVTGEAMNTGQNFDYVTIKYDPDGNVVWTKTYHGGFGADRAKAIAVDAAGNVYVTGQSTGDAAGTRYDYATIKYDTNGNQLWVQRYNPSGNQTSSAYAIVVDSSGNVYVTGSSRHSTTNEDWATLKYNASGTLIWERRFNNSTVNGFDEAYAMALDNDENIIVTGVSQNTTALGGRNYATIKYSPTGTTLWTATYTFTGNNPDLAFAIAIDSANNVYVTGESFGGMATDLDYATIKYNSSGVQQWVARYNGPANGPDRGRAIRVHPDGSVYVTGVSRATGTTEDYLTIKYTNAGAQLWTARYDGFNGPDDAKALRLDADGNAYVTGWSRGTATFDDIATIKYKPTGELSWVVRYTGPVVGPNRAHAMDLDDDGNIYIAGQSHLNNADYITLKYSQPRPPQFTLSIHLEGASHTTSFVRGMEIYLGGTGGGNPILIEKNVTFTANGHAIIVLTQQDGVPSNNPNFNRVSVKDPLHTARRAAAVAYLGNNRYEASVSLKGGDANGDNVVDIVDFALFAQQFGHVFGTPDTPVGTPAPHCDFSANGVVSTADYTFIVANFLFTGDPPPGSFVFEPPRPRKTERVEVLLREGVWLARKMDLDLDGWVTASEIARFLDRG